MRYAGKKVVKTLKSVKTAFFVAGLLLACLLGCLFVLIIKQLCVILHILHCK
jgi:hypothetical protein